MPIQKPFTMLFSVRCTSEQDAKLVLTPDYMQKLLELSAERGKRFAIRFLQDGTLLLVIKDMNLFEMGKSENTVQLVEKLEKEMEDLSISLIRSHFRRRKWLITQTQKGVNYDEEADNCFSGCGHYADSGRLCKRTTE